MTRLVLFLLAGGAVAAGAAWIADHDGIFLLTMNGYEIRTSAGFGVFLMMLAAALLLLLLRFLFLAIRSPMLLGSVFSARRDRAAYQTLATGLIAAASGETEEAEILARRSGKMLPGEPLTLLLKAQTAQLSGREDGENAVYRAMLDTPETEYLGLRGLATFAMRRKNEDEALTLLARARALKPKGAWSLNALFGLRVTRREWREALELLTEGRRAKLVTAEAARRRRGVLLAAQSEDEARIPVVPDPDVTDAAPDRSPEPALFHALEAADAAPGLTLPALIAAPRLAKQGRSWKAQDLIEAAWAHAPHPDLAASYAAIRPEDDREARARRLGGLAQLNPMHRESRILAARQGIARGRWAEARAMLELLVRERATQRLCMLMAEIALGEGDPSAAQTWQTRAAEAPPDAQWHCASCGEASPAWSALCPHCGVFDSLAWTLSATTLLQARSRIPAAAPPPVATPALFFRLPDDPGPPPGIMAPPVKAGG